MDDRFLTPSRLGMLQQVADGVGSASEIARATGISLPYVLTQLQLLEAKNFIKKVRQTGQAGPGKPKQRYALASSFAHVLLAKEGFCEKVTFSQAPPSVLLYLQLASFVQQQLFTFSRYYWKHSNYFKHVTAVALLSLESDRVELLALTTPEMLDPLRKHISNEKITGSDEKKVQFITWVHSQEEIKEGLGRNDSYYTSLLQRMRVLADDHNILAEVQA